MYFATRTSVWIPVPITFIQAGKTHSAAKTSFLGLNTFTVGTSWVQIVNCL